MDFKNNNSTTPEQSERLLGLGVKPETADMHYTSIPTLKADTLQVSASIFLDLGAPGDGDVPSWSLSRLLEMIPYSIKHQAMKYNLFDALIDMIEWLIDKGYFNQDYLIHSNSSKTGKEETK